MIAASNGTIDSQLAVNEPIRSSPVLQTQASQGNSTTAVYFAAGPYFYMAQSTDGNLSLSYSKNIGSNVVSSAAVAVPSAGL